MSPESPQSINGAFKLSPREMGSTPDSSELYNSFIEFLLPPKVTSKLVNFTNFTKRKLERRDCVAGTPAS